jgi:predicted NBD/HSP70 family sugar kinase
MTTQQPTHSPGRSESRGRVLRALLRHGPVSQQGLVHRTRLNQATVSRVLAELKRHGFAVESEDQKPVRVGRGRRPTVVDLDRARTAVLGIQLGLTQIYLGLVDLRGALLANTAVALGPDPTTGLENSVAAARALIRESLPPNGRVLGIGVGAAGPVDLEAGTVRFGMEEDRPTLPVRELLAAAFGVPVFLANNVHAMALAEAWFGIGPQVKSVALLYVGRVIRLAVVAQGRVWHGEGPRDGMVGHAVLDPEGPPCPCGQRGCLEVLASDARVETEARLLGQALPDSFLARQLAGSGSTVLEAVAVAARAGDPGAANLLLTRARWLARAIVTIHYVLHPTRLLITGTPQLISAETLPLIQQEVARLAPRLDGEVGVVSSTLPMPNILIVGPATLVLEVFFSQDRRWAVAEEQAAGAAGQLEVTA